MSVVTPAKKLASLHNSMLKRPVPYARIVHQTEKAMLIQVEKKQVWLPKTQVTLNQKSKTAYVPTWLIKKLALIPNLV